MNKNSNVFRFKQFLIDDSHCAMKVGTDAILLASWIPEGNYQHILDIGTGSGLIAIMMAQKSAGLSKANILGIDINAAAISQATANAQATPWSSRLSFLQNRLQDYETLQRYDLIVSNPPFFEGSKSILRQDDANYTHPKRRTARQTIDLSFCELIESVSRLLENKGKFYCILPYDRADEMIELAMEHKLHCVDYCSVKSTPLKAPKRSILGFSRQQKPRAQQSILIRDADNSYSLEFKKLCQEFYLNF